MKRIGILVSMLLVVSMLAWGTGCAPKAAPEVAKPILIGHVHSMSGAMSMYGISCATGGEIAVDEINAAGGVLGRPLKQITRDDKLSPEVGLREAKILILDKKVDFLTGTISSAVGQAISDYCKTERKIFIINISQSSRTTEELGHRYIFRIDTNAVPYFGYGPALALAERWPEVKTIVSLGFDYEMGWNSLEMFKEKLAEVAPDVEIIDELWPPLGTTDFTPYISKIAASGADAFYLATIYGGGELAFTKQAYAFGLYDKMGAIQPCAGDVETWCDVKEGEPYPKGALATARYPFYAIEDPANIAFYEEHYNRVGFWPSYGAMNQYFIIYALKDAIEQVGAVDTERIIDALEGMVLDTFVGKVLIREYDHQAMMPTWYGIMAFTPDLTFPHLTEVKALTGESSYHSVEHIKKLRGE